MNGIEQDWNLGVLKCLHLKPKLHEKSPECFRDALSD